MALMSFNCPRSLFCLSSTKNTAEDGLFELVNRLKPDMAATNLAAGRARAVLSAWFSILVVPSSEVPDGVDTETAIKPWSSVGIKPDGVVRTK